MTDRGQGGCKKLTKNRRKELALMPGPYDLESVRDRVEATSMGVYMLGRYSDSIHYVGRSDTNLQSEILHAGYYRERRYLHFWFEYSTSPMRAYKRECELWHDYGPPDNTNHPAKPWGSNWRCPVEGCPYCLCSRYAGQFGGNVFSHLPRH